MAGRHPLDLRMFVDTYHASSSEAVWGEDGIGLRVAIQQAAAV
jgi:hypothetical protein